MHNLIGYRRRQSRWWHDLGLWGWWGGTGLHGIVELGPVTPTEFMSALGRHGEVRLQPLDIEKVRTEVYRAARSVTAVPGNHVTGRYQSLKIAIEPVIVAASTVPIVGSRMISPMPMIV